MSKNHSHYALLGIENDIERYVYAGWLIFVVLCSLFGDTTILVASFKYKAFRLNKIVVAFIQHIAACDLINAVLSTFPIAISAVSNSGGSSKILNYARFFMTFYVNIVSSSLIAAMTLGKCLQLKYPLRARIWSKRQVHKVCSAIWMALIVPTTLHFIIGKEDVIFDYRVYTCTYLYSASVWKILLPVIILLTLFVPNKTIIVSTVLLLKKARKAARGAKKNLRWQGTMTVIITAICHTLSVLPMTVYLVVGVFLEKGLVAGVFFVEFYRIAMTALNFNVVINFFVYSLTVTSFRQFLKNKFRHTASWTSNSVIITSTSIRGNVFNYMFSLYASSIKPS